MNSDIDAVDYAILKCFDEHTGCWKKKAHAWVNNHQNVLPGMKTKSVQTIGRHIDNLHDAGYVESCILSPDSVNRDMIIGYKLTDEGKKMLTVRRNDFLHKYVKNASKELLTETEGETAPVDREPLVALMSDAFDIDPETKEEILPQIETDELLGLLAVHFFLNNAGATFDTENEDVLAEFLARTPKFRRPFEKKNIIARIRERLASAAESSGVKQLTA